MTQSHHTNYVKLEIQMKTEFMPSILRDNFDSSLLLVVL